MHQLIITQMIMIQLGNSQHNSHYMNTSNNTTSELVGKEAEVKSDKKVLQKTRLSIKTNIKAGNPLAGLGDFTHTQPSVGPVTHSNNIA